VEIAVQIGGKIRTRLRVPTGAAAEEVLAQAKADEKIAPAIAGMQLVKELYVPGKLVNLVVKPV
jgi:leucyl-tRNA synthetase